MTVLAAALSSSPSNSTMNDVEPGLLGFLVVAAIGVALVFLLRSMNKQFRKLGPPPEESADTDRSATGEAPAGEAAGAADADDPTADPTAKGAKRR